MIASFHLGRALLEMTNRRHQTIYADKKKSKIIGVVEWAWRRFE